MYFFTNPERWSEIIPPVLTNANGVLLMCLGIEGSKLSQEKKDYKKI